MDPVAHINPSAVTHLVVRLSDGERGVKSEIATDAGMTVANLREFERGVRSGTTVDTRVRLAAALGCPVEVITCWCDRPDMVCRNLGGVS